MPSIGWVHDATSRWRVVGRRPLGRIGLLMCSRECQDYACCAGCQLLPAVMGHMCLRGCCSGPARDLHQCLLPRRGTPCATRLECWLTACCACACLGANRVTLSQGEAPAVTSSTTDDPKDKDRQAWDSNPHEAADLFQAGFTGGQRVKHEAPTYAQKVRDAPPSACV